MSKNLIVVQENELYVGTWDLAVGYHVTHQAVKKLVNRHKAIFERSGIVGHYVQQLLGKKKGISAVGRKVEGFLLNEQQAMFLGTLLKNSGTALEFKHHLCEEFLRQRRAIDKLLATIRNNKLNTEWVETREARKVDRRYLTDRLQIAARHAIAQGSKTYADNPRLIYTQYTLMLYKAFFPELFHAGQKIDEVRDKVGIDSLNLISVAERLIGFSVEKGVERGIDYHDIYQNSKNRVQGLAIDLGIVPYRLTKKPSRICG